LRFLVAELGEVPIDEYWHRYNPYAEWYWNSLRIGSKPYKEYHERNFGKDQKNGDVCAAVANAGNEEMFLPGIRDCAARTVVLGDVHADFEDTTEGLAVRFSGIQPGAARVVLRVHDLE